MEDQEPYQDPEDQENTDLQDSYEAEETLSLCDLPIYSDASNWDDYSKEDQRLSDDNDFFEFLSEDFTASTCATTVNKNIIFCGKIIPCKDLPEPEKTLKQESTTNTKRNHAKTGFLRWKSLSFNKRRSSSKYSKLPEDEDSKTLASPSSKGYVYGASNCDFSVGKVSMLASSSKSRWYLFMFGMTRFPTEMELRDMKMRQSRMRSQSSMFRSVQCDEMIKGNENRSRGKGLWRLLRVLGLGSRRKSQHSNAVVKASFGCIPLG
ncbi:hypothetical protein I3843_07G070000 [Carya illinoinensis]|uniref:Uncharacterized protein n=1 Tax=Carya illinoinensis TaxID=32201 RepID=A0A8T1PVX1_CARIL|nr:uncharacterized protein LOC122316180 [Carya illinoinensis]KAG6647325.1 hypothetical protein CIPAW_07G071600 [Carya illinoinensis]KAG7970191.1 hypothetical protein I3843_07G070000 [Carya illinoinensis]